MSNNCLVTKFKGTSISDLPVYNELVLRVNKATKQALVFKGSIGTRVYVKDGTGFFSLSDDMSDPFIELTTDSTSTYTIYLSDGDYTVGISNRCDLEVLQLNSYAVQNNSAFNIEDLKYLTNLDALLVAYSGTYGDISAVKNLPSLRTLSIVWSNISGDFKAILDNDGITYSNIGSDVHGTLAVLAAIEHRNENIPGEYLTIVFNNNTKGYISGGSLDDLIGTTTLRDIHLQGDKNKISGGKLQSLAGNVNLRSIIISELSDYTNFDGSVEAFVAGQIANGRTTCPTSNPITCPWLLHLATFGGNKYNREGQMYLTWESANKIAVFQGGSGGIENTHTVYYSSGYSASDFPGKTAIPVD